MFRKICSIGLAVATAFALTTLFRPAVLAESGDHVHAAPAGTPAAPVPKNDATAAKREAPKAEPATTKAMAVIEPRSGSPMTGRATFTAADGKVTMEMNVEGLAPGPHAVHLHEKGDCSAPDAASAGPHWNPSGADHGKWGEGAFHHGDIGNIEVGKDGKGRTTLTTELWTLGGPEGTNILGRSVIVHANVDDFKTQPTGNAGGRIGCGVIAAQ